MRDPDQYDDVAEVFARYSERAVFPITACLLEMTGLSIGQWVLDVACGSGMLTRAAAAVVGASGRAIGIDLSPGQIRVATSRSRQQGYHWNEFSLMDALRLGFANDSFDVVVAQFPHLPDRERCLAEMFRVLKPGGTFAICNGGGGAAAWPLAQAPLQAEIAAGGVIDGLFWLCLSEHFPHLIAQPAGNAPVVRDDPHVALRNELEQAGFGEICLWSYAYTAPFESAEEAFEWESVRTSAYRMAQSALNPTSVVVFKRDYLRKAQVKRDQYGLLGITTAALFGMGYKPVRD